MITSLVLGLAHLALESNGNDMFWVCDGLERFESPVKIVPGPKLRVISDKANIVSSKKTEIEFQPSLPGLKSLTQCALLSAEGTISSGYGTTKQPLPALSMPVLLAEQNVKYFGLVAGKQTKLGEYRVQIDPSLSPIELHLSGTKVVATSTSQNALIFFGQEFLGLSQGASFGIDARRLAPGYYEFFTVTYLKDGVIGPMAMSPIWIPSRWKLDYPQGQIAVEKTTLSAKVQFESTVDKTIKRTWLNVDGIKTGSFEGGRGAIDIDLRNVATGTHNISITAECEDSRLIAPEYFKISVINPVLDSEKARNKRMIELDQRLASVKRLDQEIVDLYEQALRAPEIVSATFSTKLVTVSEWGTVASITLIDQWKLPGDAGRLMGMCGRRILERASSRIDIAKLLIQLGRMSEAKTWLIDAISDAGEKSATATEAKNLLKGIR